MQSALLQHAAVLLEAMPSDLRGALLAEIAKSVPSELYKWRRRMPLVEQLPRIAPLLNFQAGCPTPYKLRPSRNQSSPKQPGSRVLSYQGKTKGPVRFMLKDIYLSSRITVSFELFSGKAVQCHTTIWRDFLFCHIGAIRFEGPFAQGNGEAFHEGGKVGSKIRISALLIRMV